MPGILKLENNVPQVIALAFAEGKHVDSLYRKEGEFLFSLATPSETRMYLPPVAADKIKAAGIGARIPFEICRKQVGKAIEWQIRSHNAAAKQPEKETGALVERAPVRNTSPNSTATETNVARRAITAPQPAALLACADRPLEPGSEVTTTRLMSALLSAIEAVIEAETYMAKQGMDIQFTSEDIRALGITAYIQDCKEQGGRA